MKNLFLAITLCISVLTTDIKVEEEIQQGYWQKEDAKDLENGKLNQHEGWTVREDRNGNYEIWETYETFSVESDELLGYGWRRVSDWPRA